MGTTGSYPQPNISTFKANSDLSAKQFTFVKLIDNQTVDSQSSKGGKVVGILMNAPKAGDFAEVAMPGGGAKLKIGGTVTFMDKLTSNTSSQGIADDAAGQHIGAQSLDSGVSGDVIAVQVVAFESQA